ncbi:polysaccharide deacetylase family protein [Jiella sp. M17.18]|uniref:polysaccharide deacetylase family protein n=1 Tax=Jiella sp. M17.18 TaxID=3234247 RepID=UPI0034DF775D
MNAFSRSRERLAAMADSGRSVRVWWRDDDARWPTRPLSRLLSLQAETGLPLALAVVPEGAEPSLAEALAGAPDIAVLLHGWRHANHAPEGEKRAEYGDHRPASAMADEIAAGRDRLASLFGERFLPVFVPPWNRIGGDAKGLLSGLGLPVLSVYGPAAAGSPAKLNTHLDIMNWSAMRGLSLDALDARLAAELERRLLPASDGEPEPLGLLTHHLQHDDRAWYGLEHLLALLLDWPSAVRWPPIRELIAQATQSRPGA